ncbi:hypothetical protein CHLRE_09g391763v5 [Chlamydomonas reinhardtii]|uniref:Uncharacterized protein n=1 Tax=Chlamydomonas reinhardtii TaxID=3055 RepID=A0A2K3DE79_CHLRE|nr:uncharacterized protein CHLRE_09g391763v5 [Chlamydomonas reinhardtii]PNW78836.1 hypothetical protein CHLRE_09g391763v5 [Chlamydomonas reinhardtii]
MAKGGKDKNGKSIAAKNLGAKMHGALGHISWQPLFLLVDAWLEENCGQGRRPPGTWEKVLAHLRQLPDGAHLPPSITGTILKNRYGTNKTKKEKKEKKEKEEKEEKEDEKEE